MNRFYYALILTTSLLLQGCANQTTFNSIGDPSGEERRVLVTFSDRSITRVLNGNSQDTYQMLNLA